MKLEARKEQILDFIVRHYVNTATPISSEVVCKKSKINISTATARNIMLELDQNGFLTQPHTSAGRIPTEKGYRYFIKNLSEMRIPAKSARQEVAHATSRLDDDIEIAFHELSHVLAHNLKLFSGVGILQNDRRIFSYGMADVFREPEFKEHALTVQFANFVEHLEDELDHMFENSDIPQINIGTFGMVSAVFRNKHIGDCMLFSIGPQRMDYEAARSLLKYTADDIISQTIST
ncbi:MAG: hypothetical protein AAB795_00470 [Patescibacteria group bacterium]